MGAASKMRVKSSGGVNVWAFVPTRGASRPGAPMTSITSAPCHCMYVRAASVTWSSGLCDCTGLLSTVRSAPLATSGSFSASVWSMFSRAASGLASWSMRETVVATLSSPVPAN